ncbi:MAG TPA: hypothetical protein VK611_09880 [Acidimicrobiales bacterium]|nr:hypothetical protein [Acidimicrobiales bacterium]
MVVLAIPQFERLAVASTLNYGGPTAGIIVVQEDVDTVTGGPLDQEAARVADLLLGVAGDQGTGDEEEVT